MVYYQGNRGEGKNVPSISSTQWDTGMFDIAVSDLVRWIEIDIKGNTIFTLSFSLTIIYTNICNLAGRFIQSEV
jgi:hypothetical protein